MFVSKNIEVNKIKDKIYKQLKTKYPTIRFSLKYFPKSEKQNWDYMLITILTKGVNERILRDIDNICINLQKLRYKEPPNKKGVVDYIESEYDCKPINQLRFE